MNDIVFLQLWLDIELVMIPQFADDGREYLTNVSDHGEGEGDANDGKEYAEDSAREGDRGDVPVADGGEDGGREED